MKIHHEQHESSDEDQELDADINIVPLVDVVLVLLIIFMITAPLSLSTIKVNLPETVTKETLTEEAQVILTLDDKGRYYLGKQKVDPASVRERLKAIFDMRQSKVLYIQADRNLKYESVTNAMNEAHLAGIKKISLLTQQTSLVK